MKYLLLFAVLLLAGGCGTSSSSEGNGSQIVDPYSDPPGYTGDPFAGFGQVSSIEFPAEAAGDAEYHPDVRESVEPGGAWSVQVAACASLEAAMTLRDVVAAETGVPVFVDHTGSYYKVRAGSFDSSGASDSLRAQLRSGGYPDAWSVERVVTPPALP